MDRKTLIIGDYKTSGLVDSVEWWGNLPNLTDYDTLIVDAAALLSFASPRLKQDKGRNVLVLSTGSERDSLLEKKAGANLTEIKKRLLDIFQFDTVAVYVLHRPAIEVESERRTAGPFPDVVHFKTYPEVSFQTDEFLPITIKTEVDTGKTISVADSSYARYFAHFQNWEYCYRENTLEIQDVQSHYGARWVVTPHLRILAANKVGKPLAVAICPYFYELPRSRGEVSGPLVKRGGRLVLLPVNRKDCSDTSNLIRAILKIAGVLEEIPPPPWVHSILIPGEEAFLSQHANETTQLAELEARIKATESSLAEVQKYKGLLYDTGDTLQQLVKCTFEKLGVLTEPSVVTDEFIISWRDKRTLVEVKGNTKAVAKSDLAQLITDCGEHLKATGEDIHAILIGNAWRLLPPDSRGRHDTPIFTQDVVKIAAHRGIGLLSTTTLFDAYCKALEKPADRDELINKILSTTGEIAL